MYEENLRIEDGVVRYCAETREAEEIQLPKGVTAISGAFAGHKRLRSVQIPEGVRSIDESAFYGCENLESLTLPNTLTEIGFRAFDGCKKLYRSIKQFRKFYKVFGIRTGKVRFPF